jgi:hypothetical protein
MKLSDDLNDLIESARTDGKLSEKERQVIIKKAVNEGHDKDEFEIYFEGIILQAEKAKKKQLLNNFFLFFWNNLEASQICCRSNFCWFFSIYIFWVGNSTMV